MAAALAGAWKASAGALARLPVARAANLARALQAYRLAIDGDPEDGRVEMIGLHSLLDNRSNVRGLITRRR